MNQEDFEIAGIVLQLIGGAYIVYASGRTWSRLAQFTADVSYTELGQLLNALRNELAGHFMHQTLGFAMLVLGGLAQLVASTW